MKISSLFVALLLTLTGYGRQILPDSVLSTLRANYPQEKVFVQTDKTYYVAGETMWMKAWCILDGSPSYLSRIVYVELVNSQGTVVKKKMYKLDSLASTPADIELPDNIEGGNYSVNAYTLWMLNFPEYVFRKSIFIYNNGDYKERTATQPAISMHFFPEGGDLITGVKNRVAFKIEYMGQKPPTGIINDAGGKKIADIVVEHQGMGSFEIEPMPGLQYVAKLSTGQQFTLPATKDDGIVLRIENTNPNRLFVMLNLPDKNKDKYKVVKLMAQMHHQLVFKATLNTAEGQLAAPISKKNLPPGIMQITLFDEQDRPLAERLAFVENYTFPNLTLQIDSLNIAARGSNRLHFSIDQVQKPTLSCLVTSEPLLVQTGKPDNIASAILLTSDLRGYVREPGYYFANKDASTLHHLDLLLMTHGWRRFEWKKVLNNQFTALKYPVESAISFRGTVTKSDSKELVKDGKVSFIIKGEDSTSILAEAQLTDKGEFLLSDVNYMKAANVAFMGTNNKKANFIVDVKLSPGHIDSLKRSLFTPIVNLDTLNLSAFLTQSAGGADPFNSASVLKSVVVKGRKMTKEDSLNREYAEGPFLLGKSIDPGSVKFARSVWQVIQQTVPGVTVAGNPLDPTVRFNRFAGLGGSAEGSAAAGSSDGNLESAGAAIETNGIAYYLNEVNVTKETVNMLAVEDLALIKVLKNEGAVLGATEGVIALYTKKGVALRKAVYDKAYTVERKEGYAVIKQFYSPDYHLNPGSKETDRRTTLYWNGRMSPSRDGTYRLRFFNNDLGKRFKLIVQGIDETGKLIYIEKVLE